MRILMLALGTRGDLQLMSALGERLAVRGHAVVFASWRDYLEQLGTSPLGRAAVGRGTVADGRRLLVELAHEPDLSRRSREFLERWIGPELRAARPVLETLARSCDYFISNLSVRIERGQANLPAATVLYDPPEDPTAWSHWLGNLDRQHLLPLVPLPSDWLPREAGPIAVESCTGWWQASTRGPAPMEDSLRTFLARQPRTFALTLGSMQPADPNALIETVVSALRAVHGQLVWIGGWSERPAIHPWPAEIFWVREVDYRALLPRLRGLLHHGGYGTIVASLRAGLPATVLPQLGVQRVFGQWLQQRDLAVDSIEPTEVNASRIASALLAMDRLRDGVVREPRQGGTLAEWAQRLATDCGIERGVDALERHAESRGIARPRTQGETSPRKELP
jgi:hypothetical protein